jgi:NAD(P)-dependent dehydrogenase (short-subunit alcohol dehydrogenase family)
MSTGAGWTEADLPDLSARTVLVTGASSGIGREAAAMFAGAGAHVVLACRNQDRSAAAVAVIRHRHSDSTLDVLDMDLADLSSVRRAGDELAGRYPALDVLVNNAGVMGTPYRETVDGFELQFATNHLGHFLLTGLVFDLLLGAAEQGRTPRVVTVTSLAHHQGEIRFDDPNSRSGYRRAAAYAQSKLANLLFTAELDRQVREAGIDLVACAAHPGWAATNLQYVGPRMERARLRTWLVRQYNRLYAQDARAGAWTVAYAAAGPVSGGDCVGPDGKKQLGGHPTVVDVAEHARDLTAARRLWSLSEELTGQAFTVARRGAGRPPR